MFQGTGVLVFFISTDAIKANWGAKGELTLMKK